MEYVCLNNGTLTDPLVRQVLSYAVNYQGVIASIEQGQGEQMRGPVPVGLVGYNPDAFQFSYDPDKARELLAQAGYDGHELRLMFADPFMFMNYRFDSNNGGLADNRSFYQNTTGSRGTCSTR